MAALGMMTFDQYVAWQSEQTEPNEYIKGEVVPRPEGENRAKVRDRLVAFLRERGFAVPEPGLVVLDDDTRQAFLPDVVVLPERPKTVCLGGLEAILNPLAVVEIVEPGMTEGEWRPREDAYRGVPPLREFAEIYLQGRLVDVCERHEEGWLYRIAGKCDNSTPLLGFDLPLDGLYAGIEFPGRPVDLSVPQGLSPEEYLEWESGQRFKHDYIDGRIVPLHRVRKSHTRAQMEISMNLHMALSEAFPRDAYQVFISGIMVVAPGSDEPMYPHLTLFDAEWEGREVGDDEAATNPTVVFEIVTMEDARFDVPAWIEAYATIPSLREVFVVSADERKVERRFRTADGWSAETFVADRFPVLGKPILIERVYRNVEFPG